MTKIVSKSYPCPVDTDTVLSDVLRDRGYCFRKQVKASARTRVYTLGTADLDDIFSETCLRVLHFLRSGEQARNIVGLACKIARHLAIDRVRRSARADKFAYAWQIHNETCGMISHPGASELDLNDLLRDILAQLSTEDQALLLDESSGLDQRMRKRRSRALHRARQIGQQRLEIELTA